MTQLYILLPCAVHSHTLAFFTRCMITVSFLTNNQRCCHVMIMDEACFNCKCYARGYHVAIFQDMVGSNVVNFALYHTCFHSLVYQDILYIKRLPQTFPSLKTFMWVNSYLSSFLYYQTSLSPIEISYSQNNICSKPLEYKITMIAIFTLNSKYSKLLNSKL